MTTASAYLTVRGIDVDVVYKDIKNLHIGVYPPMGRVRVAAPRRLDDEQVRLAVIQRLSWIKRQRGRLQSTQRQSEREMVTGESHYVWGIRRRLKVIERPGRAHFETEGDRLMLYAPEGATPQRRREYLDGWYREQLRQAVPALISKWEQKLDLKVPRWSIRRMKTKWGSCNRETRHIWINVELAKKHPDCLEYILVHEMTHYLERNHGERFTTLMDGFMPDWRSRRDQLNDAPLAEEDWEQRRA
ncbi:SprT family zinc-dependent metalloprotease [Mycobacterium ulcerans]|nr:SprT family zinc-dependent metalloprotease [Mycobacterium ulcerans]MEB3906916.1 SprT family zinc-dependent metalloprotease [Mycobacterium ulcerans]MEB3911057.1 SprT family zinc-dependent metalloprotease [Mycobacterium ulcerans]MEB3921307.1 SprT family zinc-dependent metalloprotease [Mycobacterium ulcerans]MEB3925423.1 SprT family zinc-dependent metalloprotease [Mycobacterium ulcerans]MEB3929572.1 SprT family zinc-dependent metalloprotease [Mycobacterium ulcerans]